jgi:hypothetical protein
MPINIEPQPLTLHSNIPAFVPPGAIVLQLWGNRHGKVVKLIGKSHLAGKTRCPTPVIIEGEDLVLLLLHGWKACEVRVSDVDLTGAAGATSTAAAERVHLGNTARHQPFLQRLSRGSVDHSLFT